MDNLTDFLLARIAEDQARAERMDEHYAPFEREWEWCPRARDEPLGDLPGGPDAPCECSCPQAKRRARAECEAKRRIVKLESSLAARHADEYWECAHDALQIIALPYAAHPDYREEWRP